MFRWFENRLDPFPAAELSEPPRKLLPFCMHFTRGAWPYIILAAILTAGIAVTEVWLFAFLGNIVDWLSGQSRETFLQTEGWKLIGMALIALVVLPLLVFSSSLLTHQTLMGNYPMRIRWLVHRYLLKQSMAFYQDEFAGRIATKLMQTALAVRECVIKLIDVLNYICVYFIGTLLLVGMADWRLTLPMFAWLIGYILLMRHYVPVLGKVAEVQADARSLHAHRAPADAPGHHALQPALSAQCTAIAWRCRYGDLALDTRLHQRRCGCRGGWYCSAPVRHVAVDHVGALCPV